MRQRLLLRAPVTTASGYGVHSRQILKALMASGEFDISVEAINWGNTSYISEESPFITAIKAMCDKRALEVQAGQAQYDISIQVTIPNEFQKLAALNIGVTAGIEVDRISPAWIQKINENVDLVIVPSRHSLDTLVQTAYQLPDGRTLRVEKSVAVCPEGFDPAYALSTPAVLAAEKRMAGALADMPDFCFFFVGLGDLGRQGEDRKNTTNLIKWFCERFKNDAGVGLVLKYGTVGNSLLDFNVTKQQIARIKAAAGCSEFPKIKLVHGRLSDAELASLYKAPKIKCFISLTHGEGYGLPMLEAAASGKPVMAVDWSGHKDFLYLDGTKKFVSIDHELAEIPQSAVWTGVMEAGSRWAVPNEVDAKLKMKKIVLSPETPTAWAQELAARLEKTHSIEAVSHGFMTVMNEFLSKIGSVNPQTQQDLVAAVKQNFGPEDEGKKLLFTMPMSAGDVFISTGTVRALKEKYSDHKIFFATQQQYADILKDNPDIHKIIPWQNWMGDVSVCERIFDEVYTPNLAIQLTTSNWIRKGKGRKLADEIAAQCGVEFGNPSIQLDEVLGLPEKFIALQPGSGKGQWEARNYLHWQEVVSNISKLAGMPVVQLGAPDDPLYKDVVDFRGKTSYNQLAYAVSKAACLVGIDTVSMHMAAVLGTPHVALFGSSYPGSTGPAKSKGLSVLLGTTDRYGCDKACYKYQCEKDAEHPCVNEIKPSDVVASVLGILWNDDYKIVRERMADYKEYHPNISGYTHLLNAESAGYPYIESIKSMLGFCDEVVVLDGGSTDGTLEKVKEIGDERVKLIERAWDWEEPGMDGMQKAYARAMCSGEFLWQQDADEVVHEDDCQKIRDVVKKWPKDLLLLHLPVVELWGNGKTVRTDRHSWKWRLSKNDFRITHGIHKNARVVDEKTGRTYAKKGQSDGCEFIDVMTGEFIPHRGFYNDRIELGRRTDPKAYGEFMNQVFDKLPVVFHYSWASLPRKIKNFKSTWNRLWSNLYNDPTPEDRFPGVETDEQIVVKAEELRIQGGEHGKAETFQLNRSEPKVMETWWART